MSDSLTVPFGALHGGPVRRTWKLDEPADRLGDLPVGVGGLEVEAEIGGTVRDGVRARGTVRTTATCDCRRCLETIDVPIVADLDVWFRAENEVTPGEDGVFPFAPRAAGIDLVPAVREEILLGIPDYPVCEAGCAGLCPTCGVRLADEECTCPPPGPDPRWAALEGLGSDES